MPPSTHNEALRKDVLAILQDNPQGLFLRAIQQSLVSSAHNWPDWQIRENVLGKVLQGLKEEGVVVYGGQKTGWKVVEPAPKRTIEMGNV